MGMGWDCPWDGADSSAAGRGELASRLREPEGRVKLQKSQGHETKLGPSFHSPTSSTQSVLMIHSSGHDLTSVFSGCCGSLSSYSGGDRPQFILGPQFQVF